MNLKIDLDSRHRDFPSFRYKVISDDISLDADVGDDVLGVVVDGVLGVEVGSLAEAPQVQSDRLLELVGDRAGRALLAGARVLVDVLIFLLEPEVGGPTQVLPLLALGPGVPVNIHVGRVVL